MNLEMSGNHHDSGNSGGSPAGEPPPQIRIDYQGIKAERAIWHTNRLDQFIETSKLRTRIDIINGTAVQREETTATGETMAMKKIAAIEIRTLGGRPDDRLSLHLDRRNNLAIIGINDQVIYQILRDQSSGAVSDTDFFNSVNSAVRKGMRRVLWEEKRDSAGAAFVYDSFFVPLVGIPAAAVGIAGYWATMDAQDFVFSPDGLVKIFSGAKLYGEYLFIKYFIGMGRRSLGTWMEKGGDLMKGGQFVASPSDFNPGKHLLRYALGQFYLGTDGKTLVSAGSR